MERLNEENGKIDKSIKLKIERLREMSEELSVKAYPLSEEIKAYLEEVEKFIESSSLQFNEADSFAVEIKEACKKNAASGWCMSTYFPIGTYRKIADSVGNLNEIDRLFVNEFESNNFDLIYTGERLHYQQGCYRERTDKQCENSS
ncbi:hypothetical protein [Paenibacillus pabuli]|uniref:hypothetical protein n=1 Tax=Paenibacillus pabuli TaxID=1472 RepID=UPI000B0FAAFC|nr:hypothetical protein [Paenibacillus pabuli]MEC0124164.1 hypothetical protein [Paenibacillus pabuli]